MSARRMRPPLPDLSPGDAHAVLRWLYALGKISARDVRAALHERDSLVAEATRQTQDFGGHRERFLRSIERLQRSSLERNRPRALARERAAWKAERRYMEALSGLSKTARGKVEAIRERRGLVAAIAAANRLGAPRG